jgi:hypothetical protein
MTGVPVLIAVCVAAAIAGLVMAAAGIRGTEATPARPGRRRVGMAMFARQSTARSWAIGAAAGLVVWAVSGWPVAGIATALAVPGLPKLFGAGKHVAARIAVLQGLEEWVRRLSDAIAAGAGPTQTITSSAAHAPAAIKPAVGRLSAALSTGRTDTSVALARFAGEIDDPLGDMVAVALKIAITAPSAKVPDVLRTLAGQLAEDVKARRDIETDRAEPRAEARMIVAVQIAFAAAVALFTSYADAYATLSGQLVLGVIVAVVAGALVMLRRLSVDTPPARLLAATDAPGGPATLGPVSRRRRRISVGVSS